MLTSHSSVFKLKRLLNKPKIIPVLAPDPAPALGDSPPTVIPAQKAGKVDHLSLVSHGI